MSDPGILCYRRDGNGNGNGNGKTDTLIRLDERPAAEEAEEESLRCASCGNEVTSPAERITVQEAHEHRFVNPAGYVFRVGCFRRAPGCISAGEPTEQHTWFQGYLWSFALCRSCFAHLGWVYQSGADDLFYGLILDRLVRF